MGNLDSSFAPPVFDLRIERCKRVYGLPDEKIMKMWPLFIIHDKEKKGQVLFSTFLLDIIHYPPTPLTEPLPQLLYFKSDSQMNFGEFIELVCTFCCFEDVELLKYLFHVLDPSRTGYITILDLKHMLLSMHNKDAALIREGLQFLDSQSREDPTYNFKQLTRLRHKFPFLFHPLFRLQTQMMSSTLGVLWWETHKIKKHAKRQEVAKAEIRRKERDRKREEAFTQEDILKKRMGVRYYVMPWMRVVEERKLMRIAAVEEELETKKMKLI